MKDAAGQLSFSFWLFGSGPVQVSRSLLAIRLYALPNHDFLMPVTAEAPLTTSGGLAGFKESLLCLTLCMDMLSYDLQPRFPLVPFGTYSVRNGKVNAHSTTRVFCPKINHGKERISLGVPQRAGLTGVAVSLWHRLSLPGE